MPFFPGKSSIVQIERAKNEQFAFDAISKIERSTGVRLGSLYLASEAREFIAREILEPECPGFIENIPICDGFFFSQNHLEDGRLAFFNIFLAFRDLLKF